MNNFFSIFFGKKMVGIDIGTSAIKVIEVSRSGNRKTLENYAELRLSDIDNSESKDGVLPPHVLALAIKEMMSESKIKTKKVIFSIPDFSTFCTSFEIPPMPKEEVAGAITYNAAQYITLPISEVTLDWQVAPKNPEDKNSPLTVFLVAIPNQIIEDYKTIAKMAGLELYALEAEVIGIKRALIKDNKKPACLIDLGLQSSTISVLDKGFLKESYSFEFTSKNLETSGPAGDMKTLAQPLLQEIEDVCLEFSEQEKREVEEIYLTGGGALVAGLKEYLQTNLGKKTVLVPNGFLGLNYNAILGVKIKEMSPRFSAALGVALGGLEG